MIFCVEDDGDIRELIVYTLQSTGFEAAGLSDGVALWQALEETRPQLILLDIMMPGDDGLTILRKLREDTGTKDIPVIMVTAKTTEYDKVSGLDLGADDYIAKPFGMMELVARIRAVLRRIDSEKPNEILQVGEITVDVRRHHVTANEQTVELTLKEFQLLQLLMENQGVVLTRDQLLSTIWGYDFDGETRTVDVHVRTLRAKLGACGDQIETVRGVGYRIGEKKHV